MQRLFYRLMLGLSRMFGPWVVRLGAWWVATGYFILFPRRRAHSTAFYRALFPLGGRFFPLRCAWRQYHRFTAIFLDRQKLATPHAIACSSVGWEHLDAILESGRGAVLVMSHIGNWELAARLMQQRRPGLPVMLVMGRREGEQIEGLQKKGLVRSGIQVLAADPPRGAATREAAVDVLEARAFLKKGGLVALSGDRLWHPRQRAVAVRFLGRRANLPELPHALAHLSGVPMLRCFAVRDAGGCYRFCFDPPTVIAPSESRALFVGRSAQQYADRLEQVLREHPFEWFHFGPFLGERLAKEAPLSDQPGFSKKT
jgi:predicted LPLAT superfamily acyltransferase